MVWDNGVLASVTRRTKMSNLTWRHASFWLGWRRVRERDKRQMCECWWVDAASELHVVLIRSVSDDLKTHGTWEMGAMGVVGGVGDDDTLCLSSPCDERAA
jgi:hypothetical protein